MKVVYTPEAQRQIEDLHAYIAERSYSSRADEYVGRLLDYCDGLETFPKRGTRRDHLLPGLRTIGFERRITIAFVVEEEDEAVIIVGVFYGGQDIAAAFRK